MTGISDFCFFVEFPRHVFAERSAQREEKQPFLTLERHIGTPFTTRFLHGDGLE
jgi:hypothetical protein